MNKHAILLSLRAAIALNCQVIGTSSIDRKHYHYPDQPIGYQITQKYSPFASAGWIDILPRDGVPGRETLRVGISHVQIEQDTAKTVYHDPPPCTLIDLNRNGSALVEIVTTPSIPSAGAAVAVLKKIQSILRSVGASSANMEAGGMRCDVNVSVTTEDSRHLGPSRRVEIKNLASFRVVQDAIEAEAERQVACITTGRPLRQETRGYDVSEKVTFVMRIKDTAMDYRYMPEPDLLMTTVSPVSVRLSSVRSNSVL